MIKEISQNRTIHVRRQATMLCYSSLLLYWIFTGLWMYGFAACFYMPSPYIIIGLTEVSLVLKCSLLLLPFSLFVSISQTSLILPLLLCHSRKCMLLSSCLLIWSLLSRSFLLFGLMYLCEYFLKNYIYSILLK